jgi:hypothetical protein
MDQRSICLFLAIKRRSAQAIHNEHVTVHCSDAIACSTVAKYLRQWQFPSVPCHPSEEPSNTVIDNAIFDGLEKQPFSSIRELAKLACIPTTTVHRHLTRPLGFVAKHLRWVPHTLTDTETAQGLTLSNKLLDKLRSIRH